MLSPSKVPLTPLAACRIMYCFITVLPGAKAAATSPWSCAVPLTSAKVDDVELSCTR